MRIKINRILFLFTAALLLFSMSACQFGGPTTDFSNLTVGQGNIILWNFIWKALDVQEDRALLITEDVIEQASFNDELRSIDWSGSYIRYYLKQLKTTNS